MLRPRVCRLCVSINSRRFLSTSREPPKPLGFWRPVAITVLIGGVSCCASGAYAMELKVRWKRGWWDNDGGWIKRLRHWWWNIAPSNRFAITVIGLNTAVFLMWRVPSLHNTMTKYFMSSIFNRSALSIPLSEFSHVDLWHLGLNMLVLWSFTPSLMSILGDKVSSFNTWPFYLTAGVFFIFLSFQCAFASMIGYYFKLMRGISIPSVGASGALLAVVSLVVFNYPNSSVYIIPFPFIPIPSSYALGGVVIMDIVGILRGWKVFDHAGHLGGVLFAVLYHWWLHRVFERIKTRSARYWQNLRTSQ